MSKDLSRAKRVVIKIGSSLLIDETGQAVNSAWLQTLADDIAALKARGQDVIVVSSGAIALGRHAIGLGNGELALEEGQAAAAAGQVSLALAYQGALSRHGFNTAQVLLTLSDTEERRRYLNARSTLDTLIRLGAIPIINENDTVATNEIRYGDNDRLAARVATMTGADCLVLLSDVDGLYDADPAQNPDAGLIDEVSAVTPGIEAMAGETRTEIGRGGMVTKVAAAKIATQGGCHLVIANGHGDHPLRAIEDGGPCTWFLAQGNPLAARKAWIAGAIEPRGVVVVDAGAAEALEAGKSLLPAGVNAVGGTFARGDAVVVEGPDGEIGRGLVAYDSEDAARIMGHKSREIEALLGYRGRGVMVHRDDLVLNKSVKP